MEYLTKEDVQSCLPDAISIIDDLFRMYKEYFESSHRSDKNYTSLHIYFRTFTLLKVWGITEEDCISLLVRKNQLYSMTPILITKHYGIAVRCLDKLSRLKNMINLENDCPVDNLNESIRDTIMDLHNYSILNLILEKNKCVD